MTEITPPSPEEPLGENQDVQATPPPPPPPPTAPVYGEGAPTAASHAAGPRPAELLDRFLARLIDFAILMAVVLVVIVPLTIGMIFSGNDFIGNVLSAVVTAGIYLGYFAFMESNQGKTVGKMVMKLRVVGPNGGNPTLEEAIKRNVWTAFSLAGIIPLIGSVIGGIGQLIAMIMIAVGINNDTTNRQAWHDQFAGATRATKEG